MHKSYNFDFSEKQRSDLFLHASDDICQKNYQNGDVIEFLSSSNL